MASNSEIFYGIIPNDRVRSTLYLIGKWTLSGNTLSFDGVEFGLLTVRPLLMERTHEDISKIKRIDSFEYIFILKSLNRLFNNTLTWIGLLPELNCDNIYEMADKEYGVPSVLYSDNCIYLSEGIKWLTNGSPYGSYFKTFHIRYADLENKRYIHHDAKNKKIEYPAVNWCSNFTDFELSLLAKESKKKIVSKDSFTLLYNAMENIITQLFLKIEKLYKY